MDKNKIKKLDSLFSSNVGKRVRILIKGIDGMSDEVATGEIHHMTDTYNTPVVVMRNVRLERGLDMYNIGLNLIDDIQFLEAEEASIKKAAT